MTGRSIMVASGKGGVGKTWLSITLAHALARQGERVLLLDADLGLANVDIQLGMFPERDLGAVLAGACSLPQAAMAHEAGFDILPGRSGSGALSGVGSAARDRLLAVVEEAKGGYAHVVVDLPAGLDPCARLLAGAADRLLVLATEEPTSMTDAYAVLKMHRQDRPAARGPGEVVVNQAASTASGQNVHATLARACARFLGEMPALAAIVPRDPAVGRAIRRQTPLLLADPTSAAGMKVEALAHAICFGVVV
jgi:flagellar biosynthesis protein FlhG